ncbi:SpoIIIAH-like family protein [Syntrophomonas palmitatica]|uniref:SpoIIIAH-like family protein n=1 Tax=Syntrophomonas palmitatica TaxID=402877 RepID=UPI0006D02089|nr:SpoIIIAH-like family protein [Syntrophomonas palmitatica]
MVFNLKKTKRLAVPAGLVIALLLASNYFWQGHVKQADKDTPVTITHQQIQLESSKTGETASSFCARYRLERERARSRELSILNGVIDKSGSDMKARQAAAMRLVEISRDIDKEVKAENLVRCRGVDDCVAIIQPEIATIVIPGKEQAQIEDIKSMLSQVLGCEEEQVCFVYHSR